MRILIIGGTRFVGDSLSRMLLADGHEIVIANRGKTPDTLPEHVERLRVDIGQAGELASALECRTFDAAINMIASGDQRTRDVLDALLDKIGHYLQCGSTGVYAPLKYCPADEDHPTDPPVHLGGFASKLESDRVAAELCEAAGIPFTLIRPTNICGAGDVPLDLWGARNPKCFQRILDGEVISIPNDGLALLQPVHREDVARPFVLALAEPCGTRIFNTSCDYALTLNYYAEVLGAILGRAPVIEHVPAAELLARHPDPKTLNPAGLAFLVEHMCFRLDRIREGLGFIPQWQPEDSLEQSIAWMFDRNLITRS